MQLIYAHIRKVLDVHVLQLINAYILQLLLLMLLLPVYSISNIELQDKFTHEINDEKLMFCQKFKNSFVKELFTIIY